MEKSEEKNTDPDLTEQLSREALKAKIKMYEEINERLGKDWFESQKDTDKLIAQNSVLTEIGEFGPWYKGDFKFDQEGRDRLLANGRQDAAQALVTCMNVYDLVVESQRTSFQENRRLSRLLIASLILNALVLLTLWLG